MAQRDRKLRKLNLGVGGWSQVGGWPRPVIPISLRSKREGLWQDRCSLKISQIQMEAADNLLDLCAGLGEDREVVEEIEISVAPGDYAWY